ncbi:glycoside hydrolase family 20 zincin-like fold domain-containing protein [Mucilaginibacter angelicae]|uniref:beta-N-acetylhexosaminidase n=1 Tax=Mucilaginibacter angelicae TaxID=869718 RepID=A0ABV6L3F2_9SPHI
MLKKVKHARYIMILTMSVLLCSVCAAKDIPTFDRYFKLLPRPQNVQLLNGEGLLFTDLHSICLNGVDADLVIPGLLNNLRRLKASTKGSLLLVIKKDLALPSDEGYILLVKNKKVVIEASTKSGLFYGMQTLNQLLEDAHDQHVVIPACRITDYPAIPVRAVHIDLKNHLDAGNYYYRTIDRLAAIKINNIIFEFEDKLRYKKAKDVGAADAISIGEFAALSKYAKDRFIEISPLVQGLGHASFILKHDAYKDLRDNPTSDWAFDPLNPKTYDLQFSMYEDAIEATPYGKYLHVGGDEVGALGKSELSKASGKSPLELQMYWLKKVTDFAVEHHRIPIFWDDMVFKLGNLYQTTWDSTLNVKEVNKLWDKNKSTLDKNIPLFPRNCIYMRWNYEAPAAAGNILALDWYKAHNLDVMAATSAQMSYAMLQRNQSNFQSIKDFCRLTAGKKLKGILCTVWDDSSPHFETTWRGIHDFAWFSWNDKDYSGKVVHAAFRHRFYSPKLAGERYEFEDILERAVSIWDTAFIVNGDRENYHQLFKLVDMPDKSKSGQWSTLYKDRLKQAAKAVSMYDTVKNRIAEAMILAERNKYNLEVFGQINELQAYSSKLLILLKQYDDARSLADKKMVLHRIDDYESQFPVIRRRLEKVFAVTRVMARPEGYKLDSNLHAHLASSTYNTDWMYWYELAMNRKVSEWVRSNRVEQ